MATDNRHMNAPVDTAPADPDVSLRNQFLVAMPNVVSGEFDHSVTLLCEHGDNGAMGLVINRPTQIRLKNILHHIGIEDCPSVDDELPAYWGGPLQPERGFVVHPTGQQWDSTLAISPDLAITTSKDILEAIAIGQGPQTFLITLGYAGWSEGQLEHELLHNSWLNTPVDADIIFNTPATARWSQAARLTGVNPVLLTGEAGHA